MTGLAHATGFGLRRAAIVRDALRILLARIRPPAARIVDEPDAVREVGPMAHSL
jgi:hypothetical protein